MSKICQNCKQAFSIRDEERGFLEKIQVPEPTFCPECRAIRRLTWRNVRSLHKRNCGLCGVGIVTMYAPDAPFPVYCNPCWQSDNWDSLSYGQEYDFSKPFFEQWKELNAKVPRYARWTVGTLVNCDFSNYVINSKNAYLGFSIVECEDVSYGENIDKTRHSMDCYYLSGGDQCYENIYGTKNFNCQYVYETRDSVDGKFLFDCANCTNCFMSSNLRNASYVFRGEQLSREVYMKRMGEIDFGSRKTIDELQKEFAELIRASLHKYAQITNSYNTTGDNIMGAKNAHYVFNAYNVEDVSYAARVLAGTKDVHDSYGIAQAEIIYESVACSFGTYDNAMSFLCDGSKAIRYSSMCRGSSDLFGCISVKSGQYVIFNKQYSKEEYELLLPKIITHMNDMPYKDRLGRSYGYGEFFPSELSPFGHNETLAQDLFPTTKEIAIKDGYNWRDPEARGYSITKEAKDLPDSIKDVSDAILQEVIHCSNGRIEDRCTTAFRITPDELTFYRQFNIPLPTMCPNCRHYLRVQKTNPLKLWHRKCMCTDGRHDHREACSKEFESTYAPERSEKVYCESCYQQAVI